ncbi:hypothetical protein SAMN04487897_104276 [Paenibacillus sp. yr247]|uniref:hypothetical protein n=1 Tax=Paenibacillus sp. yr247 TaxID=1761880 RepID=UPI00088030C5|nr:hypothetical protein [Paenibacillus sp. yr247]SDN74676.1 hypothetical protein SAMN04487897_104276 [Paenibacillus sp. yr247]
MAREQIKVPFGYELPAQTHKGTVFVFETFEDWTETELHAFTSWAEERKFVRAIFYPQHEETLRRMDIPSKMPYYARVKHLESLLKQADTIIQLDLDTWEGKRKKYTPMDTSLSFLTDKSLGPYFLCLSDRYANLFVSYPSFKEWIKKVRLVIINQFHVPLDGRLNEYAERWEILDLGNGV